MVFGFVFVEYGFVEQVEVEVVVVFVQFCDGGFEFGWCGVEYEVFDYGVQYVVGDWYDDVGEFWCLEVICFDCGVQVVGEQ